MEGNLSGKMPLFQISIVNGDNHIFFDVPYGNLENICHSALSHGNKVEVIGYVFKSIDEL